MKTLLIILAVIVLIWIAYGYFSSRVKEPKFGVTEKKDGYEIREYAPYIEARVKVAGEYREAMTTGFRILAGYIFGGNTQKQSIAMTAPVTETVLSDKARGAGYNPPWTPPFMMRNEILVDISK